MTSYVGKDATVGEELTQVDRRRSGRARNPDSAWTGMLFSVSSAGLTDLLVGVFEQVHQNRELLIGARSKSALRRQQPNVTRDFPSLEKL